VDPLLIALLVILLASLLAFLLGYIPYPIGLLVLAIFVVARILHLKNN
jgi:hypothetical protein